MDSASVACEVFECGLDAVAGRIVPEDDAVVAVDEIEASSGVGADDGFGVAAVDEDELGGCVGGEVEGEGVAEELGDTDGFGVGLPAVSGGDFGGELFVEAEGAVGASGRGLRGEVEGEDV